jgi:hypothetical protein
MILFISELLHRRLRQLIKGAAKKGDYAVLVGMHVTTNETIRWTWQTFWWAPNPENPPSPSSKFQADKRPDQLKGAARHYAVAITYTFILPNQPITGGNNIGQSVIGYNPYLEAGFFYQPGNKKAPLTYSAVVVTNGKNVYNNVGVLTNCMSCHGITNYVIKNQDANYIGDTYIDKNDTLFKGKLKTDFLWSIPLQSK